MKSRTLFLTRGAGEKGVIYYDKPIIFINRSHVISDKSLDGTYRPHP